MILKIFSIFIKDTLGLNTVLIHYKSTCVLYPGTFQFPVHSVRIKKKKDLVNFRPVFKISREIGYIVDKY